ncbi:hypothetical protein FSPOR_4496 [Fusarium sporotrichioides]|uniref:Uncharacterized protein n=1 Tax=Fusarium sporotrichioides TaxID=5514 RepID=A0A395SBA8_FUSSP|nr:hypothetical protein FSPOR_4496 [Fusarium sporotrichioides]
MHSALLLSTLSCALFNAIHAFEFTGPDSSKKLDLTQPINITWDATKGSLSEPEARKFDLSFRALGSEEGRAFGWGLDNNLPFSSGSYEWDPADVVKKIKDNDNSISSDAGHTFEATILDKSGNILSKVVSDKYAAEGFDFIKNSGSKELQRSFYTVTIALAIAGSMLL